MDRTREMARRLAPVLLVAVVTVALVGLFAGDAFAEGDTSGVVTEMEAEGKGLGAGVKEIGDVVLPWAMLGWAVVIGVATWSVMRGQKRLAEKEAKDEEDRRKRELAQEKELTERQFRLMVWDKRYEVLSGVVGFSFVAGRGSVAGVDKAWDMLAKTVCARYVFEEEVWRWMREFYDKAAELMEVDMTVRENKRRAGVIGAGAKEVEALMAKRKDIVEWMTGKVRETGDLFHKYLRVEKL